MTDGKSTAVIHRCEYGRIVAVEQPSCEEKAAHRGCGDLFLCEKHALAFWGDRARGKQ